MLLTVLEVIVLERRFGGQDAGYEIQKHLLFWQPAF